MGKSTTKHKVASKSKHKVKPTGKQHSGRQPPSTKPPPIIPSRPGRTTATITGTNQSRPTTRTSTNQPRPTTRASTISNPPWYIPTPYDGKCNRSAARYITMLGKNAGPFMTNDYTNIINTLTTITNEIHNLLKKQYSSLQDARF